MKYLALTLALLGGTAAAETATYGRVNLTGLARESWPYNPEGVYLAMVCNVNGPDGFLSIRSGPGTEFEAERKLNRLAVLEVDTAQRHGHWIRVHTAYRTHTKDGWPRDYKSLHVTGWAHDAYLCDFLD